MEGGKPPWNCSILVSESGGATTILGALETEIPLGNGGKPMEEGERTLISNLYLCLGHEGQRALYNQHPNLNMEEIRYPRFLDTCELFSRKSEMKLTKRTKCCPGSKKKERVWSRSTQNSAEWQRDATWVPKNGKW